MTLPSKELLSTVLNIQHQIENLHYDTIISFTERHGEGTMGTVHCIWNIYELAHKCKEWAITKGYLLYSVPDLCIVKSTTLEYVKDFNADIEPEAIFQACEWILAKKFSSN